MDTENPAVTKTNDGIQVTVTGLSPIAIAWTEISKETESSSGNSVTSEDTGNTAAVVTAESVATGDETNIFLWIVLMLLAASGVTVTVICGRKRKCSR